MLKKICCSVACSLLFGYSFAEEVAEEVQSVEETVSTASEIDGFLNIKGVHERDNQYPFGPKNSSAVALNPVFGIGDFMIEGDFYYGRQFTFTGYCKSARNLSKITGDLLYFYENFDGFKGHASRAASNDLDKAHFYRNYTRGTYTNKAHDFKVVIGDTAVRNTIGFQQVLSGGGISIFRQGGNGSEINGGLPIVITRVSKVECRMGDQILAVRVLTPGLYTIADFPEEAKLPGVTLKISDQINRSERLKVNYFSGYEMPAAGKDDFDLTVVCDHKWDVDNPHRMKYQSKPRYSANYRYGYTDDITLATGVQAHENGYHVDFVTIFNTEFGKISPNVAFSDVHGDNAEHALGAGIYYALPTNDLGFHLEAFAAVKGKGFGDLGKGKEIEDAYNQYIDKYFSYDVELNRKLHNSCFSSSSKQITTRLYSNPIWGITPAFVFNGEWANQQRLREYTLSFTTKFLDCCTLTLAGGLTYDDPSKGRNQSSPDRRLTAAVNVDLWKELTMKTTYSHYDDEKRRTYVCVTYTPEAVKGLELCAERFSRPGVSNPCFSVKYDCEFFNVKVDNNIINKYEDKEAATTSSHSNRQRFYFGTNLSKNGFGAHKNRSFNVARGIKE